MQILGDAIVWTYKKLSAISSILTNTNMSPISFILIGFAAGLVSCWIW